MALVITKKDVEYLRSLYPQLDIEDVPPQYEKAIMYFLRGGYTALEAARAAGFSNPNLFRQFIDSDVGEAVVSYIRQREFKEIRVTRESLTDMLLESYYLAGSAAEKIMAVKELGKMHGLYAQGGGGGTAVQVNVTNSLPGETGVEVSQKRLQRMSDEQLLSMAPHLAALLEPPTPVRQRAPITQDVDSIVSEQ